MGCVVKIKQSAIFGICGKTLMSIQGPVWFMKVLGMAYHKVLKPAAVGGCDIPFSTITQPAVVDTGLSLLATRYNKPTLHSHICLLASSISISTVAVITGRSVAPSTVVISMY